MTKQNIFIKWWKDGVHELLLLYIIVGSMIMFAYLISLFIYWLYQHGYDIIINLLVLLVLLIVIPIIVGGIKDVIKFCQEDKGDL